MKYENKMGKLHNDIKKKGERSYLSGCALIVYGRDNCYGIFSGVEYARLTTKRRNREIARELPKNVSRKAIKKEYRHHKRHRVP